MPIEQIKIGDKVLSYDEKTKTFEYKSVAQTFIAVKENIVKIKIRGEKLLTTTTEHPFYVKKSHKARDGLSSDDDEEGEWLTAAELKVGQKVLRPDGKWTRITSIEQSSEPTLVYNLEVEGNHNYFVGEIGVLSHNCNPISQAVSTFKNLAKPAEKLDNFDFNVVTKYAGEMSQAGKWVGDPAIVTRINGQLYLVDGHHRVHAAIEAGVDVVYKEVPFLTWLLYIIYSIEQKMML